MSVAVTLLPMDQPSRRRVHGDSVAITLTNDASFPGHHERRIKPTLS